jgi:hypothetical protein
VRQEAKRSVHRAGGVTAALGLALGACTQVMPRFPEPVQAAVSGTDMRRLETDRLVIYYAAGARQHALRMASRLEYCRRELERDSQIEGSGPAAAKSIFVLPRMPLNNAFVDPMQFGREQIAVIPEYDTAALFLPLNLPPDPVAIGCHEMVHDVAYRQVAGIPRAIYHTFGHLFSPQAGLDAWWHEGLAIYYETRLTGLGRLDDKYFQGVFAAGVADLTINGGWLHFLNREPLFGAQYLVGAQFIDFLATRYGHQALWKVMEAQADEVTFPLFVNSEFKHVYGKSLTELIDDFAAAVKQSFVPRVRPPSQRIVRQLDKEADIAVAPGGRTAIVTQGVDQRLLLEVLDERGETLVSRHLKDLGVGRRLVAPFARGISGLSFTADGKHLYFVALDQGAIYPVQRLMHLDVDADSLEVLVDDLNGPGGSISPDGARYYFSRPAEYSYGLYVYELGARGFHPLVAPRPGQFPVAAVVSPGGEQLLVNEASDAGIRLGVYDARRGTRRAAVAAPPGMLFHASWLDERRVVYVASDGQRTQVFETDLSTGRYRPITDAPYAVNKPYSDGRTVRFLNREGWAWTLDQAPYVPDILQPVQYARFSDAYWKHRKVDDRPVRVHSDEEYSPFDRLFLAQGWGPFLSSRNGDQSTVGLFVKGGDRLGLQLWALAGGWDFSARLPSGSFSYLNTMPAPWYVAVNVAHFGYGEDEPEDLVPAQGEPILIRETIGSIALFREWYATNSVGIGARYIDADYRLKSDGTTIEQYRFTGPRMFFVHSTGDGTPYAGRRLGLALAGTGSYLPKAWSEDDFDVVDVLGETQIALPLPLSPRHKLTLSGSTRALLEVPEDRPLLEVGGGGNEPIPVGGIDSGQTSPSGGVLPPGLRFFMPLRGFEDLALFGRRAAVGEATYTYPFILDAGSATTIYFLPAFMLRQIDLDLFFSAASLLEDGREVPLASGGSLKFRTAFWTSLLSFEFQLARRLSHDEDWAFYFAVTPD